MSALYSPREPVQPPRGLAPRITFFGIIDRLSRRSQGDRVPLPVRWRYKLDRWRSQMAGKFRSQPAAAARPRLCPACGTLVGAGASRCHQCGANMSFSVAAASRSIGRLLPQTSPVSYGILSLCCVLYGVSLLATMHQSGFEAPTGGLGALSESWRHQRPDSLAHGRVPASALRSRAAVAVRHGRLPARKPAAHRLQYVGADGHRADDRGDCTARRAFFSSSSSPALSDTS